MKAGMLLIILHDVTEKLVGMKLLDPVTGDFSKPDLEHDFELVGAVEEVLKSHGVEVPTELDKIIGALPLFVKLLN